MESTTVSSISHSGARPETGFSRKAVRTICDQRSATRLLAKAMQIIVLSVEHQSLSFCRGSVDLWVFAARPNRMERFAGDRPIPCFALGLCPSARVRKCFRWTHAITMMMPALSLPLPPSRGKGI
jgi:hypothetical protein